MLSSIKQSLRQVALNSVARNEMLISGDLSNAGAIGPETFTVLIASSPLTASHYQSVYKCTPISTI